MHSDPESDTLEGLTKQVAKGGGIAFIGQVIGRFFTLILQILLTRVLGVTGYGLYALGNSVLGIGHTISMLGLHNGVVRFGAMYYGAQDKARLKGTLLMALGISFGAAWIVGLVIFFLANLIANGVFNEPELASPLRLFAFAIPFYTLVTMISFSARALRRIDYDVAISHLFRPIFTLLAVGGSFLLGYKLMGAVAGFVVSTVLAAGLGMYLLHRLFPDLTSKLIARYEPRKIVFYSLTVLFVGLSYLLIIRTDRIMLGILGSAEDVGIYNAAVTLSVQATLFLVSFNAIFSPIIADLFHRGRIEELAALFKTTTKWIFALTLPVVLVFVFLARQIMHVFGPGFSTGAPALISLSIAELVNAGVGSVTPILTMTGHHKIELMNSLTLGGLNIVLNYLLIPRFQVLGAGMATGLSITLVNIVRLAEIYWLYKVHPYKRSYWKPIIAGGIGATTLWGMTRIISPYGYAWIWGLVVFVAIYTVLILAFGLDHSDRLIIRGVISRFSGRKGE